MIVLLLLSTIIQSAFYLFSIFHWIKKPIIINKKDSLEPISIIIAAHNEQENLKILVPHLLEQTYSKFEIIIALDRCSDESTNYVSAKSVEHEKLKFIIIDETPNNLSPKKYALTASN